MRAITALCHEFKRIEWPTSEMAEIIDRETGTLDLIEILEKVTETLAVHGGSPFYAPVNIVVNLGRSTVHKYRSGR